MATSFPRRTRNQSNKVVPPFVVGRAPWWQPVEAAARFREGKRKISFANALKDFLQNVSFHCYGKLVEPHRRFHERFFWIIFHLTMLSIMIVFLWKTQVFGGQFLSTTLFDPMYPIQNVPFPTFSICSLNRMSNSSVTAYAERLNMKDPAKRGVNYFYAHIKKLSYPYSKRIENDDNFEDFLEFQNFLDVYDTKDTEVFYNTRSRMIELTPNCTDILVHCRLAGEDFDCMTKFTETLTANGLCCTFNEDGLYSKPRPPSLSFFKEQKGLTLLLNSANKDEFFKQSYSAGFVFYIHSHGYYPEVSSGSVKERFVQTAMHTYLSIVPSIMETVSEARILSPSVRKCYFDDEQPRYFGKQYSANNCITRCRMHSMLVLCNCLLFMYPEELLTVGTDYVYCTLRHKACLERYYFKWSNVITVRANIPGLEREMEDSLYCPECLPVCTSVRYDVRSNALPLTLYNKHTFPEIAALNMTSLALTKVYFSVSHVQIFRRILKDTWFEVL
ncbi:unnamed protein product, partial [Ceratitis capitata]